MGGGGGAAERHEASIMTKSPTSTCRCGACVDPARSSRVLTFAPHHFCLILAPPLLHTRAHKRRTRTHTHSHIHSHTARSTQHKAYSIQHTRSIPVSYTPPPAHQHLITTCLFPRVQTITRSAQAQSSAMSLAYAAPEVGRAISRFLSVKSSFCLFLPEI
jgi:hypothetical protein